MVKNTVDFLSDNRYSILTMNGTIFFENTEQLVEFLRRWVGQTAMFTVHADRDGWKLQFTGGY
jgi:hypothetical protein